MRGRVLVLITALAVLVLVSNFALKAKRREEIKYEVEKKDFSFTDVKHGTSIAGRWRGEDYVIAITINFSDSKLNMNLVLKDKKGPGNIGVKPDNYGKSKQKLDKFRTCAANGTRPVSNQTCKPRPLGFITRLYNTCQTIMVTMTNCVRNGAAWAWNGFINGTMAMVDKGCNGVMFVSCWTWERMIWLANEARETVTLMAEWVWDRITSMAEKMGCWAWDGVSWLAERIWWEVSWLATRLWDVGTWCGNRIAVIYTGCLKGHVTNVKAWFARLTWRDVNRFLLAVLIDWVTIEVLTRAEKAMRQRRLERHTQLSIEAAAAAAAAARRKKRAAIENLKNRHKKKQF